MKRIASVFIVVVSLCTASGAFAQTSLVQQGKTQLKNKQYTSAFTTFKKAAASGSAEAMYCVGECYERGWGAEQNMFEAFKWYKKSADKGNAAACYRTGMAYENFEGIYKDTAKVVYYIKKGADAGNLAACERYAQYLATGTYGVRKNYNESLRYFNKAANAGFEDAYCTLAQYYYYGSRYSVFPYDMEKSRHYANKLKACNTARGYQQLAFMYIDGSIGETSARKALEVFEKAAQMGDGRGAKEAAMYYLYGAKNDPSIAKSESKGIALLEKSYELGYTRAAFELKEWYQMHSDPQDKRVIWAYRCGHPNFLGSFLDLDRNSIKRNFTDKERFRMLSAAKDAGSYMLEQTLGDYYYAGVGVEKNYKEAFKMYYASATNPHQSMNSGFVFNKLGNMYVTGTGTAKSYSEAVKWYRKGTECGYDNEWPMYNLANCYFNGWGVTANDYTGFSWMLKSAKQNNTSAMAMVSVCYIIGKGTSKNNAEAFAWAKKGADAGDKECQYVLGICYLNGYGTQQNVGLCREYLTKSANQGFAQAKADLSKISSQQTAYNTNPNDIYKQGMEMINNMYKQASNVSTETLIKWGEAAQRQGGTYDNSNTYNNSSSSSSSPTRVTCPRCNGKRYHPESYTDCADIYSYNNQAGTTCYICGQVTKHCHYPCLTCQSRGTVEKY